MDIFIGLALMFAGASAFFVLGGLVKPPFKQGVQQEKHEETVRKYGLLYKIGGAFLFIIGLIRLIS